MRLGERLGVEKKLGFRVEGVRGVGGLRLGMRLGAGSGGEELGWDWRWGADEGEMRAGEDRGCVWS